jgi:spermidine/putrescine transport system substrate-binding protein
MKRTELLERWVVFILIGTISTVFFAGKSFAAKQQLNILVMAGYEEPQIIKGFEEKYNCKINSKLYPSSDEMMAMIKSSKKGTFDVLSPDAPYVAKLVKADLIRPLNPADYPIIDLYDRFKHFDQHWTNNKLYAVTSRWGFYGIAYNSKYVDSADMESYSGLWLDKYKGKIAIFDWYLPNMGCIGRYLGYKNPYDINQEQLGKIRETLFSLKPYVGTIAATNSDTIQALANENVWVTIAGRWLQVLLKEQGNPIELSNPKEGGVSWTEALVITKDSKNPDLAKKYIQWILSPEIQAKLAWANAFHAMVPNSKALNYLGEKEARMLGMDDYQALDAVLKNIANRKVPPNEESWKKIWQEFKSR